MEIEERASLSSFSSFSNRDLKTLALTGNNVLISNKPLKNLRSLKQSHSMPEVPTIDEMIGIPINYHAYLLSYIFRHKERKHVGNFKLHSS